MVQQNILDTAFFLNDVDAVKAPFSWKPRKLSEPFFEQLKRHPVPVEEAAIRAVNNNSMALDLYAWLAYRLHSLSGPRPITWRALNEQFGQGFGAR